MSLSSCSRMWQCQTESPVYSSNLTRMRVTLAACSTDRTEAIVEAGRVRLRPILMTTLALVAGLIPMVLTFSEISNYRVGMGWAQIGGLLSSLFLTLLVVPATYGYIDDLRLWFRKLVGLKPGPENEPAEGENTLNDASTKV